MDPAYGIPSLFALLLALAYVRRVAQRGRSRRVSRAGRRAALGWRSLSQRSEMRAGEDPTTVMEAIQRARPATVSQPSAGPDSQKQAERTRR